MQQEDGGWAIAMRTNNAKYLDVVNNPIVFEPKRNKPFSHFVTGIVLRAFAPHSKYRNNKAVKVTGEILTSRFFKPDKYADRRGAEYWTKNCSHFSGLTLYLRLILSLILVSLHLIRK